MTVYGIVAIDHGVRKYWTGALFTAEPCYAFEDMAGADLAVDYLRDSPVTEGMSLHIVAVDVEQTYTNERRV